MGEPVIVPTLRLRERRTGGQRVWEALVDHWIARGLSVVCEDGHPVAPALYDRPWALVLRQLRVYGGIRRGVAVLDQGEAGVLGLLFRRLARRPHVRLVVVVHHLLERYHLDWPAYARLARGNETALLRAAHRVVVHTREEADLVARRGIPKERITIIPLGLHPARTETPVRPLGPDEPLRLLWIGGDFDRKGLDVLLDAMTLTAPAPRLTVLGEPHHEEVARRMRSRAEALGIAGLVTWEGGIRDRDEVERFFPEHDAYVLPSRHEGHGLAVDEALLHGMPVVLSDLPVFRERLSPREACYVAVADPQALAQGLAALRDLETRRALSEAGRRRAMAFPRWEETLAGYEAMLRAEMARVAPSGNAS